MNYTIPSVDFPEEVELSNELAPEERTRIIENKHLKKSTYTPGPRFHEKKEKNQKTNESGSYQKKLAGKYKKARTKGDKTQNRLKKKK